ncbi:MAG: choloylglycine hydrolase [Clostridia bacterium]|nr:choloylglycine hydrolase [Clostridia bacterium]
MCTAINLSAGDNYFGRNLDYEHDFGEKIVITPRNYKFRFCDKTHYAMIGMALPHGGYPLYFDATNEAGLSMAGLNFPDYAEYFDKDEGKTNIASFEIIPWVLSMCKNTTEAEMLLKNANITNEAFADGMPPTPLHWIVGDKERTITVEQTKRGLCIYDNTVGVLANSPSFDMHMVNLANYMNLTNAEPKNSFSDKISIKPYSRGMGGIGLPGDLSSMSRFVRAAFVKLNSIFGENEEEKVRQFFHILNSVYQVRGSAKVGDGYEITNYTSCCNADRGIYYYATYYNGRINGVDMNKENLDDEKIIVYDLIDSEKINIQN